MTPSASTLEMVTMIAMVTMTSTRDMPRRRRILTRHLRSAPKQPAYQRFDLDQDAIALTGDLRAGQLVEPVTNRDGRRDNPSLDERGPRRVPRDVPAGASGV